MEIIDAGTITFNNGSGTFAYAKAKTTSRFIAQRALGAPNGYILNAVCQNDGTINVFAFDTVSNVPRTGDLSPILILADNR